jgi:ABC-type dipeptide/oligopeptide/nickel transport system permease subunit
MNASPWRRIWRRKTIWFSLLILLAFALVALFAPVLAPQDPYRWRTGLSNLPPMWVQGASHPGMAAYPLGTDRYGRDIASRLIYGTRTALALAMLAVPLAALIGTVLGLMAGYLSCRTGTLIMLFTDMVQSLPGIMFLVIVVLICRSVLPPTWLGGLVTLVVGFAAVSWVSLSRLVRINVLQVRSRLYIEAAVSIGATPRRVMLRHLLPNISHVIAVWIINTIPAVILIEAVLGYIGVGVTSAVDGSEFTAVSWGGMFYSGRAAMSRNPLMLIIPSLCILLLSMSFILLADVLSGANRQQGPR